MYVYVQISPLFKDTCHIGLEVHPNPDELILTNYTCKGDHILRHRGLGLQYMNLGGGTIQPILVLQRFMTQLWREVYTSMEFVINH